MKSIKLIHQGRAIVHQPIANNCIRIGNSPQDDLVLAGDVAAERRVEISRDEHGCWHSIIGGDAGVAHQRSIHEGEQISLGDYVLEFGSWRAPVDGLAPCAVSAISGGIDGKAVDNDPLSTIIGQSPAVERLRRSIRQVAPLSAPVLILGETGTGKELAARALHGLSPVADGPFIPVNCGALSDGLLEDVLFGHEKGAFTGAGTTHRGVFERADGGTLFLDEIGEMPLSQQAALLRVLDSGQVCRIGAERSCNVSFRLVAATNCDLSEMVKEKKFRLDLFHRIAVFTLISPALRDRSGDIAILADRFLGELNSRNAVRRFSDRALESLDHYSWPGNIRELHNVVTRGWAMTEGPFIDVVDLYMHPILKPPPHPGRKGIVFGDDEIRRALAVCKGNITAAARYLRVPRTTLRNRIRLSRLDVAPSPHGS